MPGGITRSENGAWRAKNKAMNELLEKSNPNRLKFFLPAIKAITAACIVKTIKAAKARAKEKRLRQNHVPVCIINVQECMASVLAKRKLAEERELHRAQEEERKRLAIAYDKKRLRALEELGNG